MLFRIFLVTCYGPYVALAAFRQVFVARHCVRSTTNNDELAGYSVVPLPSWGVPAKWCTPHGLDIIGQSGKELVDSYGFKASQLKIYADLAANRCQDTAIALVKGMGSHDFDLSLQDTLFNTIKTGKCQSNDTLTIEERQTRFASVQPPWNFEEAVEELHTIIGVGAKGRIPTEGGITLNAKGKPSGGVDLLKSFGQLMFYLSASQIPYANATSEQVNKFIAWQHWGQSVSDFNTEKAIANVDLLTSILQHLLLKGEGSTVYVGHDSNLHGLANLLDITSWDAPPFMGGNLLPSPPGSGFLFRYDDSSDDVDIMYLYREFNAPGPFKLLNSSVLHTKGQTFVQSVLNKTNSRKGLVECMQKRGASTLLVPDIHV